MADRKVTYQGQKGWYNDETKEFIPQSLMRQVTLNGVKGWYNEDLGFIPEEGGETIRGPKRIQVHESSPEGITWGQVPGKMLTNAPSSAAKFASMVVQPILHPVDTVMGIKKMLGEVFSLKPAEERDMSIGIVQAVIDRYGSMDALKNTLANDPVGVAADVATTLSGAGLALKGTSLGSKVSMIAKATDPVVAATKVVSKTGKFVGRGTSTILGKTTGAGKGAVQQAWGGGKAFRDAMRGKVDAEEVFNNAIGAVEDIRNTRNLEYQQKLAQIGQSGVIIDRKPVYNTLAKLRKDFRIKMGQEGLDFSTSKLDAQSHGPIKQLMDAVESWDDWTPAGVDALKQRIDDFYPSSGNAQAFTVQLKNAVKKQLVDTVPEYAQMTKGYEEATNTINSIKKALALNKKGNVDTAVRRLETIYRDTNKYRLKEMKELESRTGVPLREQSAGLALADPLPRNYLSVAIPGSAMGVAAVQTGGAALAGVPAFMPRFVGEGANALGRTSRGIGKAIDAFTPYELYGYQLGKMIKGDQ